MIKKLMCGLLLAMTAATVSSQTAVGDWKFHDNYSYDVKKVIETPEKVYFLSAGNLFHYDKVIDETYGYNIRNGLSDVTVKDIFYNTEAEYLLVTYDTGNIDIVNADGEIVNIGDIAAATQLTDKTINDVTFSGDKAYVAAGFGIAVIDTRNNVVQESGIFNKNVSTATIMDGHLVIVMDNTLYSAPLDSRINTPDRFTPMGQLVATDIESLSDNKAVYTDGDQMCAVINLDFAGSRFSQPGGSMITYVPYIIKSGDMCLAQNYLGHIFLDADGRRTDGVPTPAPVLTADYRRHVRYHTLRPGEGMWYINSDGLGHFLIGADGKVTFDRQTARPLGLSLYNGVWTISYGNMSGDVYLANKARSFVPSALITGEHMSINRIDSNGFIYDITPSNADMTINNPSSQSIVKPGYCVVEDPEEAGVIYIGTHSEGIYKMKDGKEIAKYDWNNFPIGLRYMVSCNSLAFDRYNNLWVYFKSIATEKDSECVIAVLSAAKRKMANVGRSDWTVISPLNFGHTNTYSPIVYPCQSDKSKNIVVIADGWDQNKLLFYNSGGTADTTSDDSYHVWSSMTDQDGKSFGPVRVASMAEDHEGALWLGTTDGVIVVRNPVEMLNPSATIERVKVPRNDGTSYADYLLSSRTVTAISVDAANRKWLGTSASGLYLVSADGREILENFTVDNSYLPSDEITSVLCDPHSNRVYVGTTKGFVEYSSDASPSAEDYSEVYAYPNPVEPGYGGWITVTGLMDNSLVKIADAAGNVFFQGRSEGGMITWDGCNAAGERVRTGVYYVFASQNGDSGSSGAVTKIMVVN